MLVCLTSFEALAIIPAAVPTFNCIGLCWKPTGALASNVCKVQYRKQGTTAWKDALDLWYDDRPESAFTTDDPVFKSIYQGWINSYRGSIVNLTSATAYEVHLQLQTTLKDTTVTVTTWSEIFPIAQTIELPQTSADSLLIKQSGSPTGYILYTHASGAGTTIDVANNRSYCVGIANNVSYVIVRGLTLKNGRAAGVRLLGNNHDIVIEGCDISGWGRISSDATFASRGWGMEQDAGIFSNSSTIERIIIQRNRIHNPRYDSNNWFEPSADTHPSGPQCIAFQNDMKGNLVIRYNTCFSDSNHYFNDIIGGGENNSYAGWPNCDSDIYGNYLADCWDDGIESDGANRNVRIWGNFIEFTYMKISAAPISIGPLYEWRNISGVTAQKDSVGNSDVYPDGYGRFFHKTQGTDNGTEMLGGRGYVFHNTVLQPPIDNPNKSYIPNQPGSHTIMKTGITKSWGCSGAVGNNGCINYVSRNNIFDLRSVDGIVYDNSSFSNSDIDYDLWYGRLPGVAATQETHGINNRPVYNAANGLGEFYLSTTSPGYDRGVRIPNFNDDFSGAAPDMGAHEALAPAMEFGVDAYVSTSARSGTGGISVPSGLDMFCRRAVNKELRVSIRIPSAGPTTVQVHAIDGSLLWERKQAYARAGMFEMAAGNLPEKKAAGEYFVTLVQGKSTITKKILVLQ